ncbi:MAG: hypothetical protein KDA71_17945 [Planctomycetales bacterium]|nr:hypothetical protein [Planctomycetales bacterium]
MRQPAFWLGILAITVFSSVANSALAQYACDCAARGLPTCGCQPRGPAYCDNRGGEPTCQSQPRPAPTPTQPRPAPGPPEEVITRETGFFQAGPRVGVSEGATTTTGVRGGGITFPEMHLRLPTIHLPCLVKYRHHAKMRVEASDAPWVSTGFENVAANRGVVASRAPVPAPRGADTDDDQPRARDADADCSGMRREYEQKIEELNRKIKDCDDLRRCIEDCLREYPQMSARPLPPVHQAPHSPVPNGPYNAPAGIPAHRLGPPSPPTDVPFASPVSAVRPVSHLEAPKPFNPPTTLQRLPAVSSF